MDPVETLRIALAGRYAIDQEVGRGGMATVYLARDLRHERQVAIKVLHEDLGAVLGPERFLAEIKTTARLQHPHILPLLDSGQAGDGHGAGPGLLFYVMPYVEGESLRDRLTRERQLPLADAIRIAREVADALGHAHGQGIIHRDVKPENILLKGGHALVADFGIALAVAQAGGTRMTQTGLSLGTPQYMSPEQAMGDKTIDARSDIYALGAVTYEMLTGEPPFTGATVQAVVAKVLSAEPERPSLVRRTIPPNVEHAVLVALAKLPADRHASAAAFAASLAAEGTPAPRDTSRWPMARRQPVTVLLVGAALLTSGGMLGRSMTSRDDRPPQPVEFRLELDSAGSVSGSHAFSISPDGRRIVLSLQKPGRPSRLVVRDLDREGLREIPGTEGATAPFFSPDGDSVAFEADGALRKVALQGGSPIVLGTLRSLRNGSWGKDGQIVVSAALQADVEGPARIPSSGGAFEPLVLLKETVGDGFVLYVPEADLVLVNRLFAGNELLALSTRGGKAVRLGLSGTPLAVTTSGDLVWAEFDGEVWRRPFDARRRVFTGPAERVLHGLSVNLRFTSAAVAVSESGDLVWVPDARSSASLVEVDRAGRERPIASVPGLAGPRYSPADPSTVALLQYGALWLYSATGGAPRRLSGPQSSLTFPAWSPDGLSLIATNRDSLDDLLIVPTGEGANPRALAMRPGSQRQPEFMPDGRAVVFIDVELDKPIVHAAARMDGSPDSAVLAPIRDARHPAISPDGKWIAYASYRSSQDEVYVAPLPGPGPLLRVSEGGGREPAWSRNGSELFYRDLTGRSVYAARLSPDKRRLLGRDKLFEGDFLGENPGRNYDVHPDGQRFLLVKATKPNVLMVRLNAIGAPPRTAGDFER